MIAPRIYADFQNLDDFNRLKLDCLGTIQDLAHQGVRLQEGMAFMFYMDDGDAEGEPDDLEADGVVQFNAEENCWVGCIDWKAIRHVSDRVAKEHAESKNGFSAASIGNPLTLSPQP